MKKVILLAACLFTLTTVSNAQETTTTNQPKQAVKQERHMTPEQHAQKSVNQLNANVTLTEDQKPKVYDLALTRAKDMEVVREKYKGQEDKKETMKAEISVIRKAYRQGLKTILTPEQLAKEKAANDTKGEESETKPKDFEEKK
jgi:Spy/CpxP family protein refolding chaperone